jgi:pimeloyl-ACP methyl ester carboxylesterase
MGPTLSSSTARSTGLEYWEHQIPEFARDHRCFAYNRRGHAKTGSTNYGFSLVNQTRDLAQPDRSLRHGDGRCIIAVAFGTTIAANYAIQYPDRVRGVVLAAWSEMHDAMQYFHAGKNTTSARRTCSKSGAGTR